MPFMNVKKYAGHATLLLFCSLILIPLLPVSATAAPGDIITVAGGGVGDGGLATSAFIQEPSSISMDASGNIYIADSHNHRIRRVDAATGIITTIAGDGVPRFGGDGGPAISASLYYPYGVSLDVSGNIYIADSYNNRIRKVDATTGIITTIAGEGTAGYGGDGGDSTAAVLNRPHGVSVGQSGDIYIADSSNNRIRRIDGVSGIITTAAGNGIRGYAGDGGPAKAARLANPWSLFVDRVENIYIADFQNFRIRKIDAATGIISTVAGNGIAGYGGDGGPATSANLYDIRGVTVDSLGDLYIADATNHRIRKVDAASGVITTMAGNGSVGYKGDGGPADAASVYWPYGVHADLDGNIYIAEVGNHRIRKVEAGIITTVAGNGFAGHLGDGGPATAAGLYGPNSVIEDASGNIYIADFANHRVRKIDAITGIITTVAGNGNPGYGGDGGPATSAHLFYPADVSVDVSGNIYIVDLNNYRIRKVDAATGIITTVAGNGFAGYSGDGGPATSASLNYPSGISIDTSGNLYIADASNHCIRKVDSATGAITTIAGDGTAGYGGDGGPSASALLNNPHGVSVDTAGNVYIADSYNHRIRTIAAETGTIATVAGNGTAGYGGDGGSATLANVNYPEGLSTDTKGNLYIADTNNNRIRKVDAATGIITTVAGNGLWDYHGDGVPATSTSLYSPSGVTVDAMGHIYIADTSNRRIRKVIAEIKPVGTININSGSPYTNMVDATLAFTCSSPAGDCTEMQLSNDNIAWSTSEVFATSRAWTLTTGEGIKTVYVKFKDNAGEWSNVYSDSIILDTIAPAVAITSPTSGVTNENTPLLTYTVSEGTVTVKVDGMVVGKSSGESLDLLAEGLHTVRVESRDSAGNTGFDEVFFTVDAPPTVTIHSPTAGPTNDNTPLLAYTVSNGTVVVKVDGVIVSSVSGDSLDMLSDGSHAVQVEATDTGGTGIAVVAFAVDTVAPAVSITSPTSGTTIDNQPLLTYSMSEGMVTVTVDGVIVNKVSGSRLDTLSNSSHTVRVESADAAGNIGFAEVTFTVDAPSGFFDDLENGTVKWQSSTGLWHVVNSSSNYPQSHSPTHSWWYGQDATGNYTTGTTNSGEIVTLPFTVPTSAKLTFWSWEQTESSSTYYDTRKVYISTNNGSTWTQVFQSTDNTATWHQVTVDLAAYAGMSAKLKFAFNTVDYIANGYRGWYVDDVNVTGSSTPPPSGNTKNEGFETGNLSYLPWLTSGNGLWTVKTVTKHGGLYAAEAPVSIGNSQSASLEVTQNCAAGNVTFWYSVSSEANWDYLRFYIDGVQQGYWSGTVPWSQVSYTVSAGAHTFKWVYSKDGSVSSGSDTAWVDDISIPIP